MDGVTYNLFIFINMCKRWMESFTSYTYTLTCVRYGWSHLQPTHIHEHDVEMDEVTYSLLIYMNKLKSRNGWIHLRTIHSNKLTSKRY
jgi:hypothetical protein